MSLIFSREHSFSEKVEAILFTEGVQALILFRLSHWLNKINLARKFKLDKCVYRLNQFFNQVDIDPPAQIGRNLLLPHPHGIVIGSTATIGNDVTIMQNVTIGTRNLGDLGVRHAQISDNVFIGPGAIILGPVVIKTGAQIGAGSIVLMDVEEKQVIIGVHSARRADTDVIPQRNILES